MLFSKEKGDVEDVGGWFTLVAKVKIYECRNAKNDIAWRAF